MQACVNTEVILGGSKGKYPGIFQDFSQIPRLSSARKSQSKIPRLSWIFQDWENLELCTKMIDINLVRTLNLKQLEY